MHGVLYSTDILFTVLRFINRIKCKIAIDFQLLHQIFWAPFYTFDLCEVSVCDFLEFHGPALLPSSPLYFKDSHQVFCIPCWTFDICEVSEGMLLEFQNLI